MPLGPTTLAKGWTIPAMKLLTNTKLALPILDDPSTRNTMSAATTSLHWPANRKKQLH